MIDKPTDLAKKLMLEAENVKIAVDMTSGNGHDSLFILENIKPNMLYAFDIQEQAQTATLEKIGNRENFHFILDSHANVRKHINEKIDLAVYNLGYLPGANKTITTTWKSTIKSLEETLPLLSDTGKIIITIYPGHDEGKIEAEKVEEYLSGLAQDEYVVVKMDFINKINNPPYCVVVGKK